MYCKNCKNFKKNIHNPVIGFCKSDKFRVGLSEGYDECVNLYTEKTFVKIMLIIGEKFGCIHFEAKI